MERLDARCGNPTRQVETVLSDIKGLKSVPEGNCNKFIEMVNVVEKAYLDLNRLNLSAEMNSYNGQSCGKAFASSSEERMGKNITDYKG